VAEQTTKQADLIRQSFVARFGEGEAHRIEDAAQSHYAYDEATLLESGVPSPHGGDDFGSSPFRYWFLYAIGHECVSRFRLDHGIVATEDELREWALAEGELVEHDGDIPDYIAVMGGRYDGWLRDGE